MMAEGTSGDVENPVPGEAGEQQDPNPKKKWKWIASAAFLLVAVILAITLGLTLGKPGAGDADTSGAKNVVSSDGELDGSRSNSSKTSPTSPTLPAETNTTSAKSTATPSTYVDPEDEFPTTPQVYKALYLEPNGPIKSRVKIIDDRVANGYASCDDMKVDIDNALKHFANKIIVEQKRYDWYERCDSTRPDYGYDDESPEAEETVAASPGTDAALAGDALAAKAPEDSFGTNNQVFGVDEADVAKSDGVYVYAAYGDVLYVWNASDATQGTSITKMPFNETEDDCPYKYPDPISVWTEDAVLDEDTAVELPTEEAESASSTESLQGVTTPSRGGQKNRRNALSIAPGWYHCRNPKPRILSLLLDGSRLTAIVSETKYRRFGGYHENENNPEPIIDDNTKLTLRVYDVSNVRTDGRPLKLLGESEIKGNYESARSVGNTGFVITTSHVNTWLFARDLYRYMPQYCGLNSSEYEKLAVDTALKNTQPFMQRMVDELQLQLDGTCRGIFQVAAMQSGNSTKDSTDGDMLGQFVQVLSFDMSSDFTASKIPINQAAAFSSGWLSSVYASQDFAATLNVGSSYNEATRDWEQSTFILGFNISGTAPVPFAYAEIPGQPLNQYATDLYDGHLRVVTQEWHWSSNTGSRTTNKIFVLKVPAAKEDGQKMTLVGQSGHLGKENESLYAVRFIDEKAFVVTYLRTDPFYVYDLSNPSNPTKLGELEIPGFSSYLHPITINGVPLMLGVGQHANETTGRTVGLKISLFDISNPKTPTENASFVDIGAYSDAGNDYKSFRYLPQSEKLILPRSKNTWSAEGNFDGFVVYDITLDSITPRYKIQHSSSYDIYRGCWYNAYMPPRSFVFKSKLTTILSHSVVSTDLDNGDKLWSVSLDEGLNYTDCSPYFWW